MQYFYKFLRSLVREAGEIILQHKPEGFDGTTGIAEMPERKNA